MPNLITKYYHKQKFTVRNGVTKNLYQQWSSSTFLVEPNFYQDRQIQTSQYHSQKKLGTCNPYLGFNMHLIMFYS